MHRHKKINLIPQIKRLEITAKGITSSILGDYKSVFKGTGLEFEEYRRYEAGHDDARKIDWKASLRAEDLLIKTYVEERNLTVYIAIDVSDSMLLGASKTLKFEYAAEIAASVAYAILSAGDNVGYCLFNDKIKVKSPPMMGYKAFHTLSRELINEANYGGHKNMTNVLKFLLQSLPPRSVVLIISDFLGLEKNWDEYLRVAGYKFDLIGIMVRDPLDEELPKAGGQVITESPFSKNQLVVAPNEVRRRYAAESARIEKKIHETFRKANADTIRLRTTDPFVHIIRTYFEKKKLESF